MTKARFVVSGRDKGYVYVAFRERMRLIFVPLQC